CGEVKKQIYDFRDFTWRNLLEGLEIKDNSLWDFTKRITRKNTNFPPFEINGNQITDDQQKAEILAKTYEKQFTPSESKIPDFHRRTNAVMGNYVKSERKNYLKSKNAPIMRHFEILNIIRNLKNRKSPGKDGLTNSMIKNLPKCVTQEITRIVNSCIRSVYFPDEWKNALIKPIPKANKNL
ncbi:hypothetical protein JGF25_23750, partial [Salmonella enterica subsp. enterica serovar Mbandaka]|nr:hypothetical protein [Salmonella enterica subsp. enterica serovar Mbandaka]